MITIKTMLLIKVFFQNFYFCITQKNTVVIHRMQQHVLHWLYEIGPFTLQEEFEDTNGVIRICISKKNRQHIGQKKKYKKTNNDQ